MKTMLLPIYETMYILLVNVLKKYTSLCLRIPITLLILFLSIFFSACTNTNVDIPDLEFADTEFGVSVLRLTFDGDNPVFLENGTTDDISGSLRLTNSFRHVFDMEEIRTSGIESLYKLPNRYTILCTQKNVDGILIYCEYAYVAVLEAEEWQLYPLSDGAPTMSWKEFYTSAQAYAKAYSEMSGTVDYGFVH